MGKLTTYILLMSGISLVFYLAGIIGSNPLLDFVFNPTGILESSLYNQIFIVIVGVGAIVVGILTKDLDKVATSLYLPYLASLLINFWQVYIKLEAENSVLSKLFFGSILMLFVVTLFEFWRGND